MRQKQERDWYVRLISHFLNLFSSYLVPLRNMLVNPTKSKEMDVSPEAAVSILSFSSQIDFTRLMVSSRLSHDFRELYLSTLSRSYRTRVWMSTFVQPRLIHNSLKVSMNALNKSVHLTCFKIKRKTFNKSKIKYL